MRLINEQMQRSCEDGQPRAAGFAEKLREAHAGHAAARQEIIGDQLPELLGQASAEGEKQLEVVQTILDSGIAGQTVSKTDIKCVHAQVADHLCRSSSNAVASMLLQHLEERGISIHGDEQCKVQCDLRVPEREARAHWWYEPSKNKWKLRKRARRRDEQRADRQHREGHGCDETQASSPQQQAAEE